MNVLDLLTRLRAVHNIHADNYRAKHGGQMWDINAQINHIHSEASEVYELTRGKEHGKPIKFPKDCNSDEEKMAYIQQKMMEELWDICFTAIAGMELINESDLLLNAEMYHTLYKIEERVGIKK